MAYERKTISDGMIITQGGALVPALLHGRIGALKKTFIYTSPVFDLAQVESNLKLLTKNSIALNCHTQQYATSIQSRIDRYFRDTSSDFKANFGEFRWAENLLTGDSIRVWRDIKDKSNIVIGVERRDTRVGDYLTNLENSTLAQFYSGTVNIENEKFKCASSRTDGRSAVSQIFEYLLSLTDYMLQSFVSTLLLNQRAECYTRCYVRRWTMNDPYQLYDITEMSSSNFLHYGDDVYQAKSSAYYNVDKPTRTTEKLSNYELVISHG